MALAANTDIPQITRFITTHNKDGKAVFDTSIPEKAEWSPVGNVANFFLGFNTSSFPPDLNNNADLDIYQQYQGNKPGLSIKGGTVLRVVDMAPGSLSPMHRTVSLDYGIVIEGEVELVLDSGETRPMKRGDIAVQRATMHAWKNTGTSWARMVFVLQDCKEVEIDGVALKEDYGVGMHGVPSSS